MNNWAQITQEEMKIGMSIANLKKGELQIKYAKDIYNLQQIIKEALIELSYMSTNVFDEDYDIKEEKYKLLFSILNKGSE